MSDDSNQRLGTLIKNARVSRRLTQQALAERSGVSVSSISAIEHGTRKLTLPLADRILGAMELDLHLEIQPMWEAIDVAIAEAARLPLKERIAGWKIEFTSFVSWFAETPYIADGLMAAALQAAPVPVTAFEMVLSRDGDTLDRLTALFDEMRASRWNMYWLQWGGGALWTEIEELPTKCLHPISIFRKVPMLTRVRLPLVPLPEIQATDGYARRVLDRMRRNPGRA
ncbi:helix-turn-helix domain-containing protein [Actinoallomurus sp. CA-150999]|uniref:helix-turn-helix domain-containing protein n=1 Tax=Actinoallomurus sp. CA-150999 TaxID=3239887 RepID=UPI003D9055BA